jgi:hypothetical protein
VSTFRGELQYASGLDERDALEETRSDGVILLSDLRELFITRNRPFLGTHEIIEGLAVCPHEKWTTFSKGERITGRAIALLLDSYRIYPKHSKDCCTNGYYLADFKESWHRFLPSAASSPPPDQASEAPKVSEASNGAAKLQPEAKR